MKQSIHTKQGFATLIAVLVLTLVATSVIAVSLLVSTQTFQANANSREGIQARFDAQTCVEIALNKLKIDNTYSGNENISLANGSCTISAVSGTGNNDRSFQTSGTSQQSIARIWIDISEIDPDMTFTTWVEQ
ncbi:hypothetical protein KC640_00360 [Candidatus Dojkabacteria bacterium]|uniref:Uncharacterized protein n=1 Tax=Candidatus Dojkabacteria bacterium TaxID=2099670 RepID=A0A955KZB4_9BACT|nr:hypothetical protein [Candidatus Dojkabacteria bacterium]